MSTILRSLNGTQKKRRTLLPSDSAASANNTRAGAQSVNTLRNKSGTPFSGRIRPLKEAAEGDEISNLWKNRFAHHGAKPSFKMN